MITHATFRKSCVVFLTLLSIATSQIAEGQQGAASKSASGAGAFELTIDNIMRGPELVGYEPRAVRWSGDNQRIYFQWKQPGDPRDRDFDTYVVNRDGSGLKKLTEQEAKDAPPLGGDRSRDRRFTAYVDDGDIVLYDNSTGHKRQITKTTDPESNPRFTRDQKRIYFTRANNLFVISLEGGSLLQLTDIRTGGAAPPATAGQGLALGGPPQTRRADPTAQQKGTESQEYLKKEERELLDIIKRRAQKREEDEEKRKRDNPRKPFQLQARQSAVSLQLSPDEKYVIATVVETGEGAKNTIVPNYVTESSFTEDISSRTKVGDTQSRTRLAVLTVDTNEVKWVDHGQKQAPAQAAGSEQRAPDATQVSTNGQGEQPRRAAETDREVQLSQPLWSDDGSKAVLMGRSADNKDRWIFALDPATAKTRVIAAAHDDAWIDGPGAFTLGWMRDNKSIYFQSERDGYAHLYTAAYDGGEPTQLTSGQWEVTGLQLSDDKTRFYLTTSEVHPGERHLYTMPVEGGQRVKVTGMPGSNQAFLSPDEKSLALIYSYSNKPPELYIQENRPGATALKVTSSPSPDFWNYSWIEPPIVTFPARDGATVYARLYKPANFKKGPAVVFVHGAGYLQNVHRWWSSYYREYMFHHLLMETWLPGNRRGLSRLRRLWARLANGDLSPHGRKGSHGSG